jgi:hypothetical protein
MKSLEKMNPVYLYATLIVIMHVLNWIQGYPLDPTQIILIIVALGFLNVIYILDKISKKL